jgi:hypothetical protein
MVPALGEEWGQDPFWAVEAIYEVDGTEDGFKLEKTLLRALSQWSDYWKGHDFSVETEMIVTGTSETAIHLMTEIWEFPLDDAVLAVALVQKLAERRKEPGEYDIACRYYDHGENDDED